MRMTAPAFDTSRFQDSLSEAGIRPREARGILSAVSDATEHLPSVDVLAAFKSDVRAELAGIRAELKTEIAAVRVEVAAVRADLAKSLEDQTWKRAQMVFGAFLLNAAAIAGVGLAIYNAVRS